LICLSVYMIPILQHTFTTQQKHINDLNRVAVLDESHIMSEGNLDINGPDVPLKTIFTNDYWGRPMNSPSSHKSWRPLTVLSFRWLRPSKNIPAGYQLLVHRLFNIITHAAISELVGGLAVELVKGFLPLSASSSSSVDNYITLLFVITKALFVLHPTHVEVTANAANRPHLLGAMCAVLLSNPSLPWGMFLLALISGYLTSETFLFTLPSIVVTMAFIILSNLLYERRLRQQQQQQEEASKSHNRQPRLAKSESDDTKDNEEDDEEDSSQSDENSQWSLLFSLIVAILPRFIILFISAFCYFGGRFYMDWLSIPEGLIRPAENPFYRLEGYTRLRSYVFVLAVHIAKSWGLDFIGFSHEYGHACVLPVTSWDDTRFTGTVGAAGVLAVGVLVGIFATYRTKPLVSVLIILQLAWMVTLFPVSGIVKVGTFISDRIVVASTVSTCIVLGVFFTSLILPLSNEEEEDDDETLSSTTSATTSSSATKVKQKIRRTPFYSSYAPMVVAAILGYQWLVIHKRTMDWMGWIPLLTSALKTCPRFAKAHLEFSKITNGLYKEEFNLTKSRWHVEQAEKFDPFFCDVHQQYAQIAIQQNSHLEFEHRLSKAVTCTFTSSGSADLWQRYWKMTLDPQQNQQNPMMLQQAQQRYQEYMKDIQKAIDAEAKKQEEEERMQSQKKKSPFFWDHLKKSGNPEL